jgi:polyhydroxybutyrate depolymerase
MRLWARHNGCKPEPVENRVSAHVVLRTWQGCEAPTLLYVVEGGGHAWPGKPQKAFEAQFGPGTTEIDATKLMFAFFLGHRS